MFNQTRDLIKLISLLIIIIFIASFAILNAQVVTLNLIFTTIEVSLSIIILTSVISGTILMYLINVYSIIKNMHRARQEKKLVEKNTTKDKNIIENDNEKSESKKVLNVEDKISEDKDLK
ncbi:MAG: hypothetical protein CSB15_01505 [Clostridiales bacterium]|nr:MAG: hypothetical protein CSB15_01505 [Clostridiales bacterium]